MIKAEKYIFCYSTCPERLIFSYGCKSMMAISSLFCSDSDADAEEDFSSHINSFLSPTQDLPTTLMKSTCLLFSRRLSSSRNAGLPALPGLSPIKTRLPLASASAARRAIAVPVIGSYMISAATTISASGSGAS